MRSTCAEPSPLVIVPCQVILNNVKEARKRYHYLSHRQWQIIQLLISRLLQKYLNNFDVTLELPNLNDCPWQFPHDYYDGSAVCVRTDLALIFSIILIFQTFPKAHQELLGQFVKLRFVCKQKSVAIGGNKLIMVLGLDLFQPRR